MSETPVMPTVAPAAPAKPLSAIELLGQQLSQYIQQREQMVAQLHMVEGAIQGAQQILGALRKEEEKAKALTVEAVKAAENVASEVVNKVVSIEDAVKKEI